MDEEKKEQEVIKENVSSVENTSENTTSVKTKKSKLPVIIAVLVVVLVALLAGAYFLTDLFKSPKQLFEKYLFDGQHFSRVIDEESEMLEKMKKDSYEATTKITIDLGNEEWEKMIKDESAIDIKDVAIVTNVKEDVKANKAQTNIKLNYQDKKVIEANAVINDNAIGLQVPDIYSKYLTIENNNLQDLFEKFGVDADEYSVPNKILTDKDLEKAITITEKDVEKIAKKYKKVIIDNIDSKDVEVDKDASVKVNINGDEKTLDAKKYTVEINEKEALEIVIDVLKELKSDKDTLKLVEENYNAMVKLYEDSGYNIEATEFNLDEYLEDKIEYLEIKLDLFENSDELNDKLSNGESQFKVAKDIQEKYNFTDEQELSFYWWLMTDCMENGKISDGLGNKHKISVYVHKGETIKTSITIDEVEVAFVSYGEGDEEVADIAMINGKESMGINVYEKTTKSGNKINSDAVLTIYANISDLTEKINIKLNVNQEVEFKKVDIEEFNSDNSININNASETELQAVVEDITAGAMSYVLKLSVEFKDVAQKIQEIYATEVQSNTLTTDESDVTNDYDTTELDTLITTNTIELENVTL